MDAIAVIKQLANTATATGGTMHETLYTRDGNLTLDKEGNLLTSDGYRVMGYYVTDGTTASYISIIANATGVLACSYM